MLLASKSRLTTNMHRQFGNEGAHVVLRSNSLDENSGAALSRFTSTASPCI